MRLMSRTVGIAVAAAALVVLGAGTTTLLAGDDEEDEEEDSARAAELKKVADAALVKAIARGKEIWSDKTLFKKPCTVCHDAADKPQLNLATRVYSYPAYSRKKRGIVTSQQKIQEMIVNSSRGQAFDDKGADIAALEAYVNSLKKK